MNKKILMYSILTIFILTSPLALSYSTVQNVINIINPSDDISDNIDEIQVLDNNNITIRIALYPGISRSEQLFAIIFNYSWKVGDKVYRFSCRELTKRELMGKGKHPLNVQNYELLIVGANYWSYIIHGFRPRIVKNIKNFLSDGGGFLGSCAGATLVSQGYENPSNFYERWTNRGVLKIANIYLNQDWDGELQYCLRAIEGLPPIDLKIEKDNGIPIFDQYSEDTINITFGGGPAFYSANVTDNPNLGEITPLLIYNEELMEKENMTLHHWQKRIFGWKKGDPIKTDYLNLSAGITTTYNDSGRIVVFGPHAEIPLIVGAKVKEEIGRRSSFSSFGIFPLPVYRLVNGEYINMSHNWWIHRRAAAWIAGVPEEDLPPSNQLLVFMDNPQFRLGYQLYINDNLKSPILGKRILARILNRAGKTIIIGDITVKAYAENSDIVEFYVDGVLKNTSTNRTFDEQFNEWLFIWKLEEKLRGVHRIELRAYDEYGNCAREGSDFLFINRR